MAKQTKPPDAPKATPAEPPAAPTLGAPAVANTEPVVAAQPDETSPEKPAEAATSAEPASRTEAAKPPEAPYVPPMQPGAPPPIPGVETMAAHQALAHAVKEKVDKTTADLAAAAPLPNERTDETAPPLIGQPPRADGAPVPGADAGIAASDFPLTDWRVAMPTPTPLRDAVLVVKAHNENEAWKLFCEHNGISDSIHPRTIQRVVEG